MENVQKRVGSELLKDRISSLPNCLIDCILNRLSDDFGLVVRTSILSTRWRLCWTRMRNVSIDMVFFTKYDRRRKLDVVDVVASILSRLDGPVDKFCVHGSGVREIRIEKHDVCQWFKLLSDKKICDISLKGTPDLQLHVGSPSFVWNCSTLTHLCLQCCVFEPSTDFCGLTNLVHLCLDRVRMISDTQIQSLISNNLMLRDLTLNELDIDEFECIVIDAPMLQTLSLNMFGNYISLKRYPNLTSANFDLELQVPMSDHLNSSKVDSFFRLIPKVEILRLSYVAFLDLAEAVMPMKCPTTSLENLKYLEFYEINSLCPYHLPRFFLIIRSSPNLKSLKFCVDGEDLFHRELDEQAVKFYEGQEKAGIVSSHVSEITFACLRGDENEVMFISTVLKCCPMIKTVTVSPLYSDSADILLKLMGTLSLPESVALKFLPVNNV